MFPFVSHNSRGPVTACPLETTLLHTKQHALTTHTHTLHVKFKIQNEMSLGRTALSVVTQNILTPPLTFSSLTSATFAVLDLNFQSVEHHLSSTEPHLLFLTET
ncbi:hypothetical protein E2C01_052690 [Portunus trituberculatus]|uniref:Uncharacterized protein n=1 Tax=Portunus trituberculatus TaxID=210409 RepID=A0A5B7GMF8_PORTR|nr:hypothetical protein [Portunus trituberculatus]